MNGQWHNIQEEGLIDPEQYTDVKIHDINDNGILAVELTKTDGSKMAALLHTVEVEEAWSDQLKDVEVNGLPDKTGVTEKAYIFMGVRPDGKGHAKLKLASPIKGKLQSRILFRYYKNGSVQAGSSVYDKGGDIVRVTLDNVVGQGDKDYTIVVGFDSNEDGELSNNEIFSHPELTYDGKIMCQ